MSLIRINNRKNFILGEIPNLHPDSRAYLSYWRNEKRKIIEGFWGIDDKDIEVKSIENFNINEYKKCTKWRFMPATLYFYVNFGTILHRPKHLPKTSPKLKVRPNLRDVDWEIHYDVLEARGFSGFEDDDKYTCCTDIINPDIEEEDYDDTCFNTKGKLKEYIEPSVYLRQLHSKPLGKPLYRNGAKNYMILATRELGKDLEENSIIYSENRGEIKIKDVNIGENIYGADGKLTKVISKKCYNNQIQYRITLADGREVICGGGHLWRVIDSEGKIKVLETEYIARTYKGYDRGHQNGKYQYDAKYFIPMQKAIDYPDANLDIDPYYLGLWLGDGNSHNCGITTIDSEIKDYIYKIADDFKLKVVPNQNKSKTCPTYNISSNVKSKYNPLLNLLKRNNLIKNKHIPKEYFYGSKKQRLSLLQGLMDTDGTVAKNGGIEFSNSNKQLAYDTLKLCRSLGLSCSISSRISKYKYKGKIKCGKESFRLRIRTSEPIFRLHRKLNNIYTEIKGRGKSSRTKIAIRNIKKLGVKPSVCIGVDNTDKLFLTNDYVVTHNSYDIAGIVTHELLTDGLKTYKLGQKIPVSKQFVGSGISSKSHDLMKKIKIMVENLPGSWKPGTKESIPSPLFKQMKGSIKPNNKWIHEYSRRGGAGWETAGSLSEITHGVWTTENPEAAAGERYTFVVCEEVGLTPSIFTIHGSNSAAQMQGTVQMGTSIYIGTGGNVEKILESEMLFTDPVTYNMLAFEDTYEGSGKIGRFFPVIYKDEEFKDDNGNTNETKATEFYLKRRNRLNKSKNKRALDMELLNYPMKPSEMFLNKNTNKFPIADIKIRIRDLYSSNNNELKYSLKGLYNINSEGEVFFETNKYAQPIYDFPLRKVNMGNIEGCIEIFEPPIKNNEGEVPKGIYIAGLDPVNDDGNDDVNRSLQSFYLMNLLTDRIVVEYTGRTKFTKDYYEQVRRILINYNATLLYENQKKGIYTYFDQKNCLYLLEDTPTALRDVEAQRGSFTGNKSKGIYATDKINYWGQQDLLPTYLETKVYGEEGNRTNLQIFKSVAGLKEMMYYDGNKKVNTDRISSLGILMIARELKLKNKVKIVKKRKRIANDPFFNRSYTRRNNLMLYED